MADAINQVYKNYKKIGGAAAFVLLGSSVLLYSGNSDPSHAGSLRTLFGAVKKFDSENSFIYAYNEYTDFNQDGTPIKLDGPRYYTFLENKEVVEPHRMTTLTVYGDYDVSSTKFAWDVRREARIGSLKDTSPEEPQTERYWGRNLERMFTSPGYNYEVKVTVYSTSDLAEKTQALVEVASMKQSLTCVYVRRELRSLTKKDREELLSAMWVPYSVSLEDGTAQYGEKYMDILSINSMHNYWAADRECDHLHDGSGFATQHLSLTLRYEMAIQSINPKIVLPYWEYTLEAAEIEKDYNSNFVKFYDISPVFSDKWFGNFETLQEPWSEIELAKSTLRHNPFGFMRAPWNFAHDSKILRYKERCGFSTAKMLMDMERPSTCESFASCLDLETFEDFQVELMHAPHGSIHIMLGGIAGGCDVTYKDGLKGHFTDDAIARIAALSAIAVKGLWREGYTDFTQCTTDSPEKCTQYCTSDDYLTMGAYAWDLYTPWGVTPKDPSDEDGYLSALGKTLCGTSLEIGDMYSSSATIDPIFWVMHTTTDRLMTYKRAKAFTFTDSTWRDSTCFGHSAGDELFFDVSQEVGSGSALTNYDLLQASDPKSEDYSLLAIFDSFDYSHCDYDKYPQFAKDYYPSDEELLAREGQRVAWGSGPSKLNKKFSFMG